MAYFVDRVVICDAYSPPEKHYKLLPGARSKLTEGRRPSIRFIASAKETKGGLAAVIGKQATLEEDLAAEGEQENEFINGLRDEVRDWRLGQGEYAGRPYHGTAQVTKRLLEWWFERDEEREKVGKRFFFCQREAVETVIYLYEVKNKHRMPETGDLLRYALKLATGTGKTFVMGLLITWATLHKRKVSGSSLTNNFLILVPNLTVRDRVRGIPRGDGLLPHGTENLYDAWEMVPPEYRAEFHPNVMVRNWQSISLDSKRDDWIPDETAEEGRFIPASVLWAMQRRARQDPEAHMRRVLGGCRDVIVLNDEAHHAYGEKKQRKGEESDFIKWNKILERVAKAARVPLVVDVSATPWYGTGSPKPDGTLFEWIVSDFSVYDAFESGLVKVVRLPEEGGPGRIYWNLWDAVKEARSKEEYLKACRGAIEHVYSNWKEAYNEWRSGLGAYTKEDPSPVLLVVAAKAEHASWLFEHLSTDYELLRNADSEDTRKWVTIRIDSKVFDAEKGNEAVLRDMVNTVGKQGKPGADVRCIVSVMMLTEGWDVKSVTHILGLRAFGSPLLTEQIIGRGLRLTNYDVLNQPLAERPAGYEETVDAIGIPFVGFPVQKRKRPKTGEWGNKPVWIERDPRKAKFRVEIPNVRSWGVGITDSLKDLIPIEQLPLVEVTPKLTPERFRMKPVVGGQPDDEFELAEFRREFPLMKSVLYITRELLEQTSPKELAALGVGPTFDELYPLVDAYLRTRVKVHPGSEIEDVGIYVYRQRAVEYLRTAIEHASGNGVQTIPVLGTPEILDTEDLRRFQWTGILADGKRCHTNKVPCHSPLEKQFADFLDGTGDVLRYFKNERFGFSITYFENNRPRQYHPDFIVFTKNADGSESGWLCEPKGEIRPNTALKREAAELWCRRMSAATKYGQWRHLFVQQKDFERAMNSRPKSVEDLAKVLR